MCVPEGKNGVHIILKCRRVQTLVLGPCCEMVNRRDLRSIRTQTHFTAVYILSIVFGRVDDNDVSSGGVSIILVFVGRLLDLCLACVTEWRMYLLSLSVAKFVTASKNE
jgi:hypothetical protein